MMVHTRVVFFALATSTALVISAPAVASAQGTAAPAGVADDNWRPWLGCWTPVERAPRDPDIQVCIVPSGGGAAVRMMTFAADQRVLDETIAADGSTQALNEAECRGSSRSQWSRSGRRLFRVTELTCDGKAPQRTAALAALEPADEWLDVQVTSVGGADNVRTRRYVRSKEPAPAEIADQLSTVRPGSTITVAGIGPDDVAEAATQTSVRAVEAWLSESTLHVPVNKTTLAAMRQANVPPNVIDLMVARAYPKHFEVHRPGSGGSFGSFADDDWAWSAPLDSLFYSYDAFYYSPFGSYRYFVDPSLFPLGGYAIVPTSVGTAVQEPGTGKVVNGSGYTRVEPRRPDVVVGRTSDGSSGGDASSGSSAGYSGGSSSSGVSASPSGYSGGGGGAQTAVPR